MQSKVKDGNIRSGRLMNMAESFFVVILAFYPLRHVNWGLDLWDTGYNYANFTYMGTEHMDPMWLFSTYLSNVLGNLLTKLPNGGTLVGMNVYTGLFVSLLALLGYWFCTRKLKMQSWLVFVGEMVAVSLCWCPTAKLYDYITYVLFLGCVILLYLGLTGERKGCLIGAGVCLGVNVLVRFSNIPEMAMILAVWAYDFICEREEKLRSKYRTISADETEDKAPKLMKEEVAGNRASASVERKLSENSEEKNIPGQNLGYLKRTVRHTGWCLLGYVAALFALMGYIHIRYGIGEYTAGIKRLFAMTENATDYKAMAMVMKMIDTYVENLYWMLRIGVIVAVGMIVAALFGFIRQKTIKNTTVTKIFTFAIYASGVALGAGMLFWLYRTGRFCSLEFYSYGAMFRPGVLFLMLTMLIGAIRIFHPGCGREEKLISGMLILVILLTSLGSNNGIYPSLNNLFVAAPYTLWESFRFIRYVGKKEIAHVTIDSFPAKCVLTAFLLLCLFQFGCFGAEFAFAEATGVQNIGAQVENNDVLKNVKMSEEKARWMTELSAYINENDLRGQEVILYGYIPSLSYYLQMPSAFNPWSDLNSYSYEAMAKDIEELGNETPVIILENKCVEYLAGLREASETSRMEEGETDSFFTDRKLNLLENFMTENNYELTFRNEKFAVYR